LQQIHQQTLQQFTLIFLRTGDAISFEVTQSHQEQIRELIADLALQLRSDRQWQ
jgi:putative RecB family exonuclease